jgi:hypothetical protein
LLRFSIVLVLILKPLLFNFEDLFLERVDLGDKLLFSLGACSFDLFGLLTEFQFLVFKKVSICLGRLLNLFLEFDDFTG